MMTIRAAQMEALARVPHESFVREQVVAARGIRPDLYASMPQCELVQLIERIVDFADEHEVLFRQDVLRFVRCALRFDGGCDSLAANGELIKVLTDPSLCGASKVDWLEQWAADLASA